MNRISLLCIDTDTDFLNNLAVVLDQSYCVHTCNNAERAIEILEETDIWIVVADYRMRGMSGIDFLEQVKEHYPNVIRILLFAHLKEKQLLEAINRANIFGCFHKPLSFNELEKTIASAANLARLKRTEDSVITDLQEQMRIVEHNAASLKSIFNSTSDGIVVFDQNYKILMLNRAMNISVQITEKDLLGTDIRCYIQATYHDKLQFRIKKSGGDLPITEYPVVRSDGSILYTEVKTKAILFEGQPAFLTIVRDITEKKQFEQRLHAAAINAEEAERERIARELHDGVGPLLSTLKIYLFDIKNNIPDEKHRMAAQSADEIVNDAILCIKEISNNVSPHILRNFGLAKAIASFIDRLQNKSSINFTLSIDLAERLDDIVEISVYRIITELVNNTIKHAKAQNVTVSVQRVEEKLLVNYCDDGCGFSPALLQQPTTSLGLQNIISRVRSLGGRAEFNPRPNQGLCVKIELEVHK